MVDNIEVFKQNSIRIKTDEKTIYVDPFQINGEPRDSDCIFITHDHSDHFSPEDIKKVAGRDFILTVPKKMEKAAKDAVSTLGGRIETVSPGERRRIGGIDVETVPAYNISKPFHPKGAGWVGYILQINGKRVYIAGDTDATAEARAVKCDVALVPIGGVYTMDAKQAAKLVNEIMPEAAIPVHYGIVSGKPGDEKIFAANVNEAVKTALKISF